MADKVVKLLNNPYGIAQYEAFKKQNRAFVDKSEIIKVLDDDSMSPYPVLLRPRRFGKSTFVQMLKCFYDISYKDRYEELFKGTLIYDKQLPSHNSYHVLNFSFAGVSGFGVAGIVNSFVISMKRSISDFKVRYPDFVFNPAKEEQQTPADLFMSFKTAYSQYCSEKLLYVMIDEYDNFANSLLSRDLELFKEITKAGGFLKDFYATIKEGTEDCIFKTFITGVSSVSLDSITSGFNIADNITSYETFNAYAGFTEDELTKLIPELVDINTLGVTVEEMISR
ncbi:MAG: AAA family ATPase, partial [Succinivibrionaceae bacterium]